MFVKKHFNIKVSLHIILKLKAKNIICVCVRSSFYSVSNFKRVISILKF